MPFADNSFDLIWSLESGEHMPQKAKFRGSCRLCGRTPCLWHLWIGYVLARCRWISNCSNFACVYPHLYTPRVCTMDISRVFSTVKSFEVTSNCALWVLWVLWGSCLRCIVCASPGAESSWWPGSTVTWKMESLWSPRRDSQDLKTWHDSNLWTTNLYLKNKQNIRTRIVFLFLSDEDL